MKNRKPVPLYQAPRRKRCPVCGEAAYSAAGIHPKCAVRQSDEERMKQIKPLSATADAANVSRPWQRICPVCQSVQHVRKKVCSCGHKLSARPPQRAGEAE